MTSVNTSYHNAVSPQALTEEPVVERSTKYNGALGQFVAATLDKKERVSAVPPEMEKRLEAWRAFLDQFLLNKNGDIEKGTSNYIDEENKFRDKNGNLIDVDAWINNWLLQKRFSSVGL